MSQEDNKTPVYVSGSAALCIIVASDKATADEVIIAKHALDKACVLATTLVNRLLNELRAQYPDYKVAIDGYRVVINNDQCREFLTPSTNKLNAVLSLFRTYHMKLTFLSQEEYLQQKTGE